jgi:hypothetical protein
MCCGTSNPDTLIGWHRKGFRLFCAERGSDHDEKVASHNHLGVLQLQRSAGFQDRCQSREEYRKSARHRFKQVAGHLQLA